MQEWEMQYHYLGSSDPVMPKSLLDLELTRNGYLELLDTYFDPPSKVNTAVRLRHSLLDDQYIITVKGPSKMIEHGRVRTEHEVVMAKRPHLNQIRSYAHHCGVDLKLAKTLVFNGKLLNKRSWYLYGSIEAGIEIAYDEIEFPNNTMEKRLEVEIKGELEFEPKDLVRAIDQHFKDLITPAKYSKGYTLRQIINEEN